MRGDVKKLKDQATKAMAKGKRKRALDCYLELEECDPKNGAWAHRAGEIYRHLGYNEEAVGAWSRAIGKYADDGFLVKAVAMCRMILRVDPANTEAAEQLKALQTERGLAAPPPPAMAAQVESPDPEAPLEVVPLARAVGGEHVDDSVPIAVVPLDAIPIEEEEVPAEGAAIDLQVAPGLEIPGQGGVPAVEAVADPPANGQELDIPIDTVPVGDEDAVTALGTTPLFSDLPPEALTTLLPHLELCELDEGEVLFRQGDPGDSLYVVADGEVAVVREGNPRRRLDKLGEGAFFGEIALVTEEARSATIEATEPTVVLGIGRRAVGELMARHPEALVVLLRFLRERLVDTLITTNPLFEPFSSRDRRDLAKRFEFLEVEPGAVIVSQGEASNGLYVLLSGRASVLRKEDEEYRDLAQLKSGDLFGEISLLTHEPAIATVRADGKCLALRLPSSTFREVIMTHPQVLAFVGDLADERRRKNSAVIAGDADYEEGHLQLL